ncbi:uncharacterized protein B0P05DRAFT_534843 [Gilbertella persicaria]|uniref:uncharacterized protein n=1 Tax=Gilbertella persicaria TaxID=101096 RepID=UPI00222127E7|nr:uncharacterized protein B0P05DRAFT_534843 [Gilbertella persicaria]KAI8084259.1 hypothetical protein B0P05DRAFT_534843 [Gilbertella persicaria]
MTRKKMSKVIKKRKQDQSVIEILSDSEEDTNTKSISISISDMKYLKPRRWLNDIVIDFVLHMYLDKYDMDTEVYISNSFFYSRLKQVEEAGEDCYHAIKTWIQYKDVFTKKLWLIPICENHHWYLMAVVNPGKKKQYITIMDSLNKCTASHTAPSLIKDFLRKKYFEETHTRIPPIKVLIRPIPVQENTFDCGLHLLRSALLFLLCKTKTLDMLKGHLTDPSKLQEFWNKTPVPTRKHLKRDIIHYITSFKQ